VAIDCVKLPETEDGYIGAVVLVCIASRMLFVYPVKNIAAQTIASILRRHSLVHGPFRKITSDNGPEFSADLTQALGRQISSKWSFASAYTPMANGYAEGAVRRIVMPLRTLCRGVTTSWIEHVEVAAYAANTTRRSAGALTPFELYYARPPRTFFTLRDDSAGGPADPPRGEDAVAAPDLEALASKVRAARTRIAKVIGKVVEDKATARRLAAAAEKKTVEFEIGQWVKVLDPAYGSGKSDKLAPKFYGPLQVAERDQGGSYRLRDAKGAMRPERYGARRLFKAPAPKAEADQIWVVDKVIAHKDDKATGERHYKVRWLGYPPSEDSYEPRSGFISLESVNLYERGLRKRARLDKGAAGRRTTRGGAAERAVRDPRVPGAGTLARRAA
jgi:hypothetical protein